MDQRVTAFPIAQKVVARRIGQVSAAVQVTNIAAWRGTSQDDVVSAHFTDSSLRLVVVCIIRLIEGNVSAPFDLGGQSFRQCTHDACDGLVVTRPEQFHHLLVGDGVGGSDVQLLIT